MRAYQSMEVGGSLLAGLEKAGSVVEGRRRVSRGWWSLEEGDSSVVEGSRATLGAGRSSARSFAVSVVGHQEVLSLG